MKKMFDFVSETVKNSSDFMKAATVTIPAVSGFLNESLLSAGITGAFLVGVLCWEEKDRRKQTNDNDIAPK